MDILRLPVELQRKIYKGCSISELKNLCCVSKGYHEAVQYLMWSNVHIPWCSIVNKRPLPKGIDKLKLTESLSFTEDFSCDVKLRKWSQVATNYKKILKHCGRRLESLNLSGMVGDSGVRLLCELNTRLQEVELRNCQFTTLKTWQTISQHPTLNKLTIDQCRICNIGVQNICASESLTELVLKRCQYITDMGMEHISKSRNLQVVQVAHNFNVTGRGIRCLCDTALLRSLSVEYTEVDENSSVVCQCQLHIYVDDDNDSNSNSKSNNNNNYNNNNDNDNNNDPNQDESYDDNNKNKSDNNNQSSSSKNDNNNNNKRRFNVRGSVQFPSQKTSVLQEEKEELDLPKVSWKQLVNLPKVALEHLRAMQSMSIEMRGVEMRVQVTCNHGNDDFWNDCEAVCMVRWGWWCWM